MISSWTVILGALATWRITHMLLYENGPFEALRRGREALGVRYLEDSNTIVSYKHELTVCMWCLSVWVGIAITLLLWALPSGGLYVCAPFALSAVVIFMHRSLGGK